MNENDAMTLLAAANPVRVDDVAQMDAALPDSIMARRRRPDRRLVLAAAVVLAVVAAALIGAFAFEGSHPRSMGAGLETPVPPATVEHPLALALGAKQVPLDEATAALGPALALPDTSLVGRSDAGPVWMFNLRNAVTVAVTFPEQGMFVDYVWPAAFSADPLAEYRSLVQDNRPHFHLIDLDGVPGVAADQNSDDTGHNFGVVAFTVGSTEIRVFGHNDQATLTSVAASILDQVPQSARTSSTNAGSPNSVSLEDVPIALHAQLVPPDTPLVQPSEAAPVAATDCPSRAHTSNTACQVTVDFPSPGLTVRYARPAPADPLASYQAVVEQNTGAEIVSLNGVPALFVPSQPSSIEFVAGGTDVTVQGGYDKAALTTIAQSIVDRSRSK